MAFQKYIDNYPAFHSNRTNQILHLVGIPTIIIGIVLPLATAHLIGGIALILLGSLALYIGHRIEGNRPALLQNPLYILAAPVWYFNKIVRRFREVQP